MTDNVEWDNFLERHDVGLQVGNTIFWVPRRQLANCSPVFNTILNRKPKNEIVKLSDKEPEDILEMLRCLFPSNGQSDGRKPIDDDNLERMLQLGDKYKISDLLASCSNFLKTELNTSTVEDAALLIDRAMMYELKDVVRAGLRRLSKFTIESLLGSQAFGSLPINIRNAVHIIRSFRLSRPTDHNFVEIDKHADEYKVFMNSVCPNICKRKRISGYRCTACDYKECGCKSDAFEKCQICHDCKVKYGKTDFVCKCVDPLIVAELEKLGL